MTLHSTRDKAVKIGLTRHRRMRIGRLPPYIATDSIEGGSSPIRPRAATALPMAHFRSHQHKILLWRCVRARYIMQYHSPTAAVVTARSHGPLAHNGQTEGIRTMPCAAAGELCLVRALTPERPDGQKCLGKCGDRLHGLCGGAEPDCDNEVNINQMEDSAYGTRGRGTVPLHVMWNFRRASFRWRARRRRAVKKAMPPSNCAEGQDIVHQSACLLASATVRHEAFFGTSTRARRGRGGGYSFVASLSHLTIDRASLTRMSTVLSLE